METEILRGELKTWERAFHVANGRKPGKEDIKADPAITAKYRKYDQSRRLPKAIPNETPQKRNRWSQDNVTPSKRRALKEQSTNIIPAATPQRRSKHTVAGPTIPPPQEVEHPTPAFIKRALGPTPQKDGQVLGIFDMLATATPSQRFETPSKPKAKATDIDDTPTKSFPLSTPIAEPLSRTPMSSAKRFYLDAFAGTPQKRKRDSDDDGTPSGARKHFDTPAFLRRRLPLASIGEEDGIDDTKAAQPPQFKKRGLVRSLSTLIQGLKKQEEEKMDDDWDILNEIEAEEAGGNADSEEAVRTLVLDSQATGPVLQEDIEYLADTGEAVDSSQEQELEGEVRRPWKKKGLKRQTRRVIMRPVLNRPKKASEAANDSASEYENDSVDETQVVEESQLVHNAIPKPSSPSTKAANHRNYGSDDDDVYRDSGEPDTQKAPHETTTNKSVTQSKDDSKASKTSGGGVKNTVRKISATAHANFRALKIKNKNSKAKGRYSGGHRRR